MQSKALLLAATALLAMSACKPRGGDTGGAANSAERTANSATDTAGTAANSVTQSQPVNAAQDAVGGAVGAVNAATTNSTEGFLRNAALSDMYEIQSSKIAQQKSKSAAIKRYAADMIKDHTKTTNEMTSLLKTANLTSITPPTALDSRRQGFIDNLNAATPENFDKTYVDQQTSAHDEAVSMFRNYADDGDNAAVKSWAQKTVPTLEHHQQMAKALDVNGADGSSDSSKK